MTLVTMTSAAFISSSSTAGALHPLGLETRHVKGHSGAGLDPGEVVLNTFDARNVLGHHLEALALLLVGHAAPQLNHPVMHRHVDQRARCPGLLVHLGAHTLGDGAVARRR